LSDPKGNVIAPPKKTMTMAFRSKTLSKWLLDIDKRDILSYLDCLIRCDLALLWFLKVYLLELFTYFV
jgi:hypothetical protein